MRKTALISIIMTVAMLFSSCYAAYAGETVYYAVEPGDTLSEIGQKFGVNYRSVMEINGLRSTLIKPGQKLRIPAEDLKVHIVKKGDTLYGVARKHGVRVADIKKASGLESPLIRPGMKLIIPAGAPAEGRARPVLGGKFSFTKEDIYLLAKLIHAEARGESLEGQIAVGAVILNRLADENFPDTIRDIIFQKTAGVYQFTPVQDGQINLEPDENAYRAAERVIKGEDPTGEALFFYNPETSSDQWIRTLQVTKVIGNHVFAR